MSESAEADLWRAVIHQALCDLEFTQPRCCAEHDRRKTMQELQRLQSEAVRFFTDDNGTWALHRSDVCHIAGIDERGLCEMARRIIAGEATLRVVQSAQFGTMRRRAR